VREVQYALRFTRADGSSPTLATGQVTTTTIGAGGELSTTYEQIDGRASYESSYEQSPDDPNLFIESGTVTFDGAGGPHTLTFKTLGWGYLMPPENPTTGMTPGVVMWTVDGGTGWFEGATGTITSNFRVNLGNEALEDDHVGTILLPG
jgi:hypothetical protein